MVVQMIERMARCAHLPTIHEEAIWAICTYLEEHRLQETRVTTHMLPATWWVGVIAQQARNQAPDDRENPAHDETLVGVIDVSSSRVLTLRVGASQAVTDLCSLALYDALMTTREPHPQGAGGLTWHVPNCLVTPGLAPLEWTISCASLGVKIEQSASRAPYIEEVRQLWTDLPSRRNVTGVQWAVFFDSALNRVYGNSPLRAREQADHRFRHLTGYRRDPASLVPALRELLPKFEAVISQEGEVLSDSLHYVDELLPYFSGERITLRRSEETEAVIWVSLDGEIITQAIARELVRRDGSYRRHRVT